VAGRDDGRRYRTFWRRFFAGLIDALVFSPLMWANASVWAVTPSAPTLAAWAVVHGLSGSAYMIVGHRLWGQTLGKAVFGIRVVDVSGRPLSWRQASLRESIWVAFAVGSVVLDIKSAMAGINAYSPENLAIMSPAETLLMNASMLWLGLELITMLLNDKRRAIHDLIAGTAVVRIRGLEATDVMDGGA
jgi:uncharacterized RDD family membrane protein YckC